MELNCIHVKNGNSLVQDYIQNQAKTPLFHYPFNEVDSYKVRLKDIQSVEYPREQLAEHILDYMSKFALTDYTYRSIEKLKRKDSAVVIAGQQAGLLTGPLYTIHKILSVIVFANRKEKELGIPVVPIFWIAGEDHDLHEVNHVYVMEDGRIIKKAYKPTKFTEKKMVSKIFLEKEILSNWVESVFESFGEGEHTKQILQFVHEALEKTETITEFFAYIIHHFFKDYGLLLIDSAHPQLRNIEQPYFEKIYENCLSITEKLLKRQRELESFGYPLTIESESSSLQLFYEYHGERVLLHFDPTSGQINGKGLSFSKEELLHEINNHPGKFSNNVVTRPLMQEMLFPTLAFIGGPGEISYWAELKECFELMGMKVPPIVPRLNITLLERNIETDLKETGLTIEEVLQKGTYQKKEEYFITLKNTELDQYIQEKTSEIMDLYQSINNKVLSFDKGLEPVVQKNVEFVSNQLKFLNRKVDETIRLKHDVVLRKFDRIQNAIKPLDVMQERMWNIFYYLNKYGENVLHDLMSLSYEFDGNHYVVKL